MFTLRKIPQFHLIFWCGNFAERLSFRRVSGESPESLRKRFLSTKFPYQEIRWNCDILCSVLFETFKIKFIFIGYFLWVFSMVLGVIPKKLLSLTHVFQDNLVLECEWNYHFFSFYYINLESCKSIFKTLSYFPVATFMLIRKVICRSSHSPIFFKIGVLKNFANFTWKHLCWSLFSIKLPAWRPATLLKKDSPVKFAKVLRTLF